MDGSERDSGDEYVDARKNFGTFATGFVDAQKTTRTRLGPGFYSLSTLSTVPYVSLVGLGRREKIFSWGEVVYIPDGDMVTVKNASFHGGDIVINGGRDFSTLPSRVTVPVALLNPLPGTGVATVAPAYPVDTRRARRAFLCIDLTTDENTTRTLTIFGNIVGSKGGHSHRSPPRAGPFPGPGYETAIVIPPSTQAGVFPLGDRASQAPPTLPHCLVDVATWTLDVTAGPGLPPLDTTPFYYVLEY